MVDMFPRSQGHKDPGLTYTSPLGLAANNPNGVVYLGCVIRNPVGVDDEYPIFPGSKDPRLTYTSPLGLAENNPIGIFNATPTGLCMSAQGS